ncbi:cytochrome c-type biogenesis protein [Bartonella schoenbuchensis]|uniref:Cytochrome c-type biogenesis protein n=1 Tax=Bartonella schoenbuchensis m07a TaxID=1094496 RepID=N6UG15_9HYPH|nr:cytochrome c-type biogenesis protein [Bartonella schoenbuchensis]ENN91484.1 cytochrome c-type biogenesis protein cycL [Bartonella schoenbuchensis m07a]
MKRFCFWAFIFYVILSPIQFVIAVEPHEILEDPILESRARNISSQLRCPVCYNQSINDSDAPLAHDLRLLIRERLKAGDNDQQIIDFLVERYGEFILLELPFNKVTWFLWLFPLIFLIIGISVIFFQIKRRKRSKLIAFKTK